MNKYNLTKLGMVVIKMLQLVVFIMSLMSLYFYAGMKHADFIQIILFSLLILFAFKYSSNTIFNHKIFYILGEYSGYLYICHFA